LRERVVRRTGRGPVAERKFLGRAFYRLSLYATTESQGVEPPAAIPRTACGSSYERGKKIVPVRLVGMNAGPELVDLAFAEPLVDEGGTPGVGG